jgi:PAS domain S-box-containing protein
MRSISDRIRRYGFALLTLILGAAVLAIPAVRDGPGTVLIVLFFLILLSAGYGGMGPGLLTTAVIVVLTWTPPSEAWKFVRLALFIGGGAFISTLAERLHVAHRRAEAGQQRLAAVLAGIGDAVIAADARGRVSFLNPVAGRLTGWEPEEATGRPLPEVFRIVDGGTGAAVDDPVERVLREGLVVGPPDHLILIARDGTPRSIDHSAAPIKDEGGTITGAVLVFRDVTPRQHAEAGRARLAAIVESSDDAIVAKDLEGIVTAWNAGAERTFGYPAAEVLGRPITLLFPPERYHEEAAILERIRRGEPVPRYESVRVTRDGERIDVALTISPMKDRDGRVIGASTIARDITERRRAEEALHGYARRLEDLSRRLLRAQEDERRRIARELHDEVGQALTAARIALDRAARDPVGPGIGPRLADAAALTHRALEQVRDLSRLLSPAPLEDLGLAEALRALLEGLAERAGLATEADIDAAIEPADREVELACYRIAQEALTNAVKHAGGTRLRLALGRSGTGLELVVEDDGAGFDVEAATARAARGSSLGMLGLRERAALAGGRLEIASWPGAGTRVRAVVPARGRGPSGPDGEAGG